MIRPMLTKQFSTDMLTKCQGFMPPAGYPMMKQEISLMTIQNEITVPISLIAPSSGSHELIEQVSSPVSAVLLLKWKILCKITYLQRFVAELGALEVVRVV